MATLSTTFSTKLSTTGVYVSLEELIRLGAQASGFSFLPRQPVHSILSGRHSSKLRGRGMDFNELKPYRQGDDNKHIDWKATRRTGKAYVRIYNEERDRSVWILLSQQESMFFGSSSSMKSVSAAHAAALALFRVLSVGDRAGAVIYNDVEHSVFRPQKGRKNVMRILEEVVRQNAQLKAEKTKEEAAENSSAVNDNTQFIQGLKAISALARHDDLIVLIGDGSGLDKAAMKLITELSVHNDILALLIYDPLEKKLPAQNNVLFTDSTDFIDINTSDKGLRTRFENLFAAKMERLEHASRTRAIPLLKISTGEPVLDQIRAQLGAHKASTFTQRQP